MKKISILATTLAISMSMVAQTSSNCSTCEVTPNLIKTNQNYDKALWDIQLDVDPTTIGTALAGVIWTGTEFWVAQWNSATIYTANASGVSTGNFTIPGVTGTRSMTTDGTDIYIGTAGTSIYRINIASKTLTQTIGTSVASCRYLTYDPTLNSNAGGFWTGAYGSNITAIDMSGNTLSTISSATHGLGGIYGLAYDGYSSGGPYLWAFDQPSNPGADLVQLNATTGAPTGLVHDVNSDVGNGSGLGGGVFICNNFVAGKNSIIGVCQGSSLFAYELADPLAIDAKMDAITNAQYVAAGNVSITGTIRNTGLNPITSVDISWDSGSGPNNQTFSVSIPSNGTYNFTHGTQLAAVAGNTYNITATVTLSGDMNPANNSLMQATTALTAIPAKKTVGEEKTGTWCGWCPRGAVGLAYMEAQNDFIGIAVHNNDPMVISAYDNGINTYIPGGYPGGGVDRVLEGDPNPNSFLNMHNQRKNDVVPCDVKNIVATLNTSNNQISVSADSEWYGSIPGNFRLSCVIVEDNVISSNQTNYYGAGGSGGPGGANDNGGPMAFPVGINNGFDFYGASTSVPASSFLGYDHVAQSLSSNNILGTPGSLPAGTVPLGVHSFTFPNVPSSVISNVANAHAVVMVVNASTGEILNADKATISVINSIEEAADLKYNLNIYPNPTKENATISFELENSNQVDINIYNAMGSLVHTQNAGLLNSGTHRFDFNGSELTSGFYFVNLTIGDKVISKKISLLK